MTNDFIEDAIDSLEKGDSGYLLIASNFDSTYCLKASNIPTMDHLKWMRRRFEEYYNEIEQRINI